MIGGTTGAPATNIPRALDERTATDIVRDALGENFVEQGTKKSLPPLLLAGLLLGGFIAFKLLGGRSK